jgi:hypothetical protein
VPVPGRLRRSLRGGHHVQHVDVRVHVPGRLRRELPGSSALRCRERLRLRVPGGLRRLPGRHDL